MNSGATRMPAIAGEQSRQRKRRLDDALDADAHQPRGVPVLHHGEQRLAVPRALERTTCSRRRAQANHRNQRLQDNIDAHASDSDAAGRQHAWRHAARVLAEGEQHHVLEHDAERDGRDQPGIRARATNGRTATRSTTTPHSAQAASARTTATASGQSQRDPEAETQHRAEHHGAALGEVHRARHRVGDVETQRQQSVHAAEAEAGNDRGRNQHGACSAGSAFELFPAHSRASGNRGTQMSALSADQQARACTGHVDDPAAGREALRRSTRPTQFAGTILSPS